MAIIEVSDIEGERPTQGQRRQINTEMKRKENTQRLKHTLKDRNKQRQTDGEGQTHKKETDKYR